MEPSGDEPGDDGKLPNNAEPAENYESLKYQLLGPSLTKAGQDAVDQRKVSGHGHSVGRLDTKGHRFPRLSITHPRAPSFSITSKTATSY